MAVFDRVKKACDEKGIIITKLDCIEEFTTDPMQDPMYIPNPYKSKYIPNLTDFLSKCENVLCYMYKPVSSDWLKSRFYDLFEQSFPSNLQDKAGSWVRKNHCNTIRKICIQRDYYNFIVLYSVDKHIRWESTFDLNDEDEKLFNDIINNYKREFLKLENDNQEIEFKFNSDNSLSNETKNTHVNEIKRCVYDDYDSSSNSWPSISYKDEYTRF